ncbi:uncharacterized protein JCM10292_003004 [Rhodotorula paludigena]|uniref:uncharacterized protein n=1 Tax=Rhodotorula paludigena TaxID=86838 RepID=UPI00317D56EE
MLPVLPFELQLRIIELAVPPLTKRNLGKVRRLSTTLPLVCRAWRDFAYRVVPVVPMLTVEGCEWYGLHPETVLDTIAASGRVVRGVELDLRAMYRDIKSAQYMFLRVLEQAEEAWLDLPEDGVRSPFSVAELGARSFIVLESADFFALSPHIDVPRLYPNDAGRYDYGNWPVGPLHPRVETLSLALVPAYSLSLFSPSIKQLLFTTWQDDQIDVSRVWPCFPNLEILGVVVCNPFDCDFRLYVMNEHSRTHTALRHLCFHDACNHGLKRCVLFTADVTSLTLPPSLLTFTVRHASTLTSGQRSIVSAACKQNDTAFIEEVYTLAQGQWEDAWDIEEWALSVA